MSSQLAFSDLVIGFSYNFSIRSSHFFSSSDSSGTKNTSIFLPIIGESGTIGNPWDMSDVYSDQKRVLRFSLIFQFLLLPFLTKWDSLP